jgi:putative membrane protein
MMGMGLGFGLFGLLFMILFWVGLIALAVWLVGTLFGRNGRRVPSSGDHELNAREILDRRYARGELTREQYDLMKQDLE